MTARFAIAAVAVRDDHGRIGVAPLPAAADLDAVREWGAAAVVTLAEAAELDSLGAVGLGEAVRARGMAWHHWPIPDFGTPGADWPGDLDALRRVLESGRDVLIHCRGGLGRSGTVAVRLLVGLGVPPAEAIARVRAARPGAIETAAQERWAGGTD